MRLLGQADQPLLRRTLDQDPYYNLFMIGDLEMMGLEHEHLFYWAQFATGKMVGVAMRYRRNWCFYDAGGADVALFCRAVDDYPEDSVINGRASLVGGIIERLQRCEVISDHPSFYCVQSPDLVLPAPEHPTRRATVDDVAALVTHYETAGEMRRGAESLRLCLAHNRIFVSELGGKIVSAVLTHVETDTMAMIGGVYTPEPLRNRGYASAAMTALCTSLLEDGRQPCLFYDNPAAGAIYRRIGFQDIGLWRLAYLQRQSSAV